MPFLFCGIHFLSLIHAISHLSRLNRSSGLKKSCTMSGCWKHSPSAFFVQKSGVNNEGLMAISRKFDYVWLFNYAQLKNAHHTSAISIYSYIIVFFLTRMIKSLCLLNIQYWNLLIQYDRSSLQSYHRDNWFASSSKIRG